MVIAALANAAWWAASAPAWAAFELALDDPGRAQEQILRTLLKRNANTAFGREHGFADIRSHKQFAQRVPARDYDDFEPWIERIRRGEHHVLTAEAVRRLVPTSGSTAARKLVPYTASMQSELNRAIGPWIADLYRQFPAITIGPAYWSVTPVVGAAAAGAESSKVAIGFDDDSDYLGGWRRHAVAAVMAVPSALRTISSIEAWRYVTLLLLLRRRNLTLISVWHPSFLELLLKALQRDWDRLISDVEKGTCDVAAQLPENVTQATRSRPDPGRAHEMKSIRAENPGAIWPSLRVISCWADANAETASRLLAQAFPNAILQPKGLLATEGVVSIPYCGLHPLSIRSHFQEFEDDAGKIRLAPDLRTGETYSVLLTNSGGLFRYRLHDKIVVDGRIGNTPSVRFAGKERLVSDRMGEKLADSFVNRVLAELFAGEASLPSFAMLSPDLDREGCRYTLYVNAELPPKCCRSVDELLSRNPQYAYCRKLGQILPPRVFRITSDPYAAYAERLRHGGQRLGDIKPVALSALDGWSCVFQGHYLSDKHVS